MSTVYNGAGTVPVPTGNGFFAISSTTHTTPITVNTTIAHGFFTGDTVEIEGADDPAIQNELNEGGLWIITVTGANSFQLNGSAGTLAGGAHGYVYDYEVQPAFQIPAPGEAASMTTLGPVMQGIINAIPFLYRLLGRRRTHQTYYGNPVGAPGSGSFSTWSATNIPTAATPTLLNGGVAGVTTLTPLSRLVTDLAMGSNNPFVYPGDELEITWCGSAQALNVDIQLFLYLTDGTNVIITYDAGAYLLSTSGPPFPFTITKIFQLNGSGFVIPCHMSIGLAGVPKTTGSGEVVLYGPAQIIVIQRRIN